MFVENIFRQPDRLVLRHPVQMSEYGDGFFCSVGFVADAFLLADTVGSVADAFLFANTVGFVADCVFVAYRFCS